MNGSLKQQTKWAKSIKRSGPWNGPEGVHIKAEEYGKTFDLFPVTNRYIKNLKLGLKIECRAAKRGEKHRLKKEIALQVEEYKEKNERTEITKPTI